MFFSINVASRWTKERIIFRECHAEKNELAIIIVLLEFEIMQVWYNIDATIYYNMNYSINMQDS